MRSVTVSNGVMSLEARHSLEFSGFDGWLPAPEFELKRSACPCMHITKQARGLHCTRRVLHMACTARGDDGTSRALQRSNLALQAISIAHTASIYAMHQAPLAFSLL